ncbi:CcdB family protein [Ramlibacter sp.]|uniref:CcdB family protein n=1 Tax=Ramlibacter sp. TaxID=1917967 RepID=UPI003D0A0F5A
MAQYDVFVNPNPNSRATVPYVVDVQSALIDRLPTRLVMPLSLVGASESKLPLNLCPRVTVAGLSLTLMPQLSAPIPVRMLRDPVASLGHRALEVSAAMDAVLSGF